MDCHLTYAAVRHANVMARVKRRMIHFGEDPAPADPDDYVLHRETLERMLGGYLPMGLRHNDRRRRPTARYRSTNSRSTRHRCRWPARPPATATSTTAATSMPTTARGEILLVTGLGVYPNLGVIDAYARGPAGRPQCSRPVLRRARRDAVSTRRSGGYRIEVLEPLQRLRVSLRSTTGHRVSTSPGTAHSRPCRSNRI